jgi:hypothetical protein
MNKSILALCLVMFAALPAVADTKRPSQAQVDADRLFKSGVALFKEGKFSEALAEFERAYEIAPHPLVLYNIAACHRELSHYAEAVKFYGRFLEEGKGKVPAARLSTAQTELDSILARIARVTVSFSPNEGATLIVDGAPLGTLLDMPLILSPGEHHLMARAPGRKDVERTIRVASGDSLMIELTLPELPPERPIAVDKPVIVAPPPPPPPPRDRHFTLGAGFGTNLRRVADTGAPSIGFGYVVGSRLELGVDAILVAFSVMPSVRVRLAGETLSVHAVAAVPVSFTNGNMTKTFVAGAAGLGVRYHATPQLSFRLETFVSFAGSAHGMTLPTFVGGELWF